jgi:hypothetical protein
MILNLPTSSYSNLEESNFPLMHLGDSVISIQHRIIVSVESWGEASEKIKS